MKKQHLIIGLAAMTAVPVFAELVPATLFNHNMVLQRDKKVAVWGKADAGADVTVSFAGANVTAKVNDKGAWRIDLPAMPACAIPREMTITSSKGDKLVYTNAVVGEVWLCGGQSNMTFAMWPQSRIGQHAGRERNGYYDLMLTNEPDIRGVCMPTTWAGEEKDHTRLGWFSFTDGNGKDFSGAAWHYAMRLHQALGIPVGVIEAAWGGSCIETWIPPEAYAESKSFKDLATRKIRTEPNEAEKAYQKKTGRGPSLHQQPRACWNAMIYPLAPYGIRGAIWYQGCTNRGKWKEYYEMLGTLRTGWGKKFECGADMPFFFCQISPYGYTTEDRDSGETQIREEMERFALDNAPNVGMAVLSDVGEIDNIHPGDKRTVGTRLAALALNRTYGFKQLKCDAPVLDKAELVNGGKQVTLTFKNVESWCMNGTYKMQFEMAGEDGKYVLVDAQAVQNTNKIALKVPEGMTPKTVTYMRKSCVHGFLKNEAGLPVAPFRRDLCVASEGCSKTACTGAVGCWAIQKPGAYWLGICNKDATPKAKLLWGGGSPDEQSDVKIDGATATMKRCLKGDKNPANARFRLTTIKANGCCADVTFVTVDGNGKELARENVKAKRILALPPAPDRSKAVYGEPINLLAGGIEGWESMNSKAYNGWSFKDGVLSNRIKRKPNGKPDGYGANLKTKRADFYDFKISYDVRVLPNCNSGVYLRGIYELQVLDSFGKAVDCHNMAAFYGRITPRVAAEKPAGEWQHVDAMLYNRHITVTLNGVNIIDNQPIYGVTGGAITSDEFVKGPFYLQGDHSDADFKNIIVTPIVK